MILSKASKQNIILFAAAFLLCGLLRVLLYAQGIQFQLIVGSDFPKLSDIEYRKPCAA